ncbi:MAG: hypothetical protein SXA11_10625 [Cyanobacteriota bacterium]|nr:hypothetical protein [Cyanobacteriota bacterium]
MHVKSKEFEINLAKLVAKTWADENFRQRFLAEPAAILREAGAILEGTVKVIVNEGSSASKIQPCPEGGTTVYEIALPSKPKDLDEETLYSWFQQFSSGASACHTTSYCSC